MHRLQNIRIARQLAREHEASLRGSTGPLAGAAALQVRRWVGLQLVRAGTRIATGRPLAAWAR